MPTALELTREQLRRRYRKARRHQPPSSPLTAGEWLEQEALLQRTAQAAKVLKTRFGARRVILFGSLAHRAWFAPDSDVDLVVEGLKGDYWQAWRSVEEIVGDREVDLIEIESAPNSLHRAIQRYGIDL